MHKFTSTLLVGLLGTCIACASPKVIRGELTVAFGKVKQADGTYKSIKGMKLPFVARTIKAEKVERVNSLSLVNKTNRSPSSRFLGNPLQDILSASHGPEADQVIYNANDNLTYGFVEGNPSSLDDVNISSIGVGKAWTLMSFGLNYSRSPYRNFLIRWRAWETNTDNPAPQNDFADEFADFGVIWNIPLNNESIFVEIDISQAGVVSNDTSIYIAQQFRDTSDLINGNGPFEVGVDTVFCTGTAPTIGSSADQFWYDHDPVADGAYENTEVDTFEGSLANHALVIKVSTSGSTSTVNPIGVVTSQGFYQDGNFLSLWFNGDADDYTITPDYRVARGIAPGIVEIEGLAPTSNITSIKVTCNSQTSINDVAQEIELWDYVNAEWVPMNSSMVGTGGLLVDVFYGGIVPISNFVSGTNRVKARVTFENTTFDIARSWNMNIDRFIWTVTTP